MSLNVVRVVKLMSLHAIAGGVRREEMPHTVDGKAPCKVTT
jgi:hypothetical protein